MDRLFSSKSKSSSGASAVRGSDRSDVGPAFPALEVSLTDAELREAAYAILLVASGSVAPRPLTYTGIKKSTSVNRPSPAEKSVTAAAASKLKKALGLRSKRDSSKNGPVSVIELVRVQLGVSEKTDARLRRALSRTSAGQAGKRSDMMIIPLELLQNITSSDFVESQEFLDWQKAQLSILEAGLLCHPKIPLDPREIPCQRLRKVLVEARQKPLETTGRNNETMQAVRSAVTGLATRNAGDSDKATDACHWADGYPLNVHLYQKMLECCFDKADPSAVLDEMDDVVDLMRSCWSILGINQPIHNITLLWVLFRQFFMTGEEELELLGAARTHMQEVALNAKEEKDPAYAQLLSSTLASIQSCVEKRLFSYHDTFPDGAAGTMDKLIPSALSAAQILHEDISTEYRRRRADRVNVASTRIDAYIRSSAKSAFAQMMEQVDSKRKASRSTDPPLVTLAKDTMKLLLNEKTAYSPILRQWHPSPAGIAAATLHSCFSRELKQYLSGLKGLTSDAVQVCQAADMLEQELVQTVVEDGVDCEDGGKSLIREMPPFEGESAISALSKKWVQTGLERLGEWAERNMTNEEWSPHVMREHYAASVVDLLRLIEETLDAFFAFPTSPPKQVLQDLVAGIDRVLFRYVAHAVSNYDTKTHLRLPPLTRWNKEHKHSSMKWLKKDKRKGQVEPRNGTVVDTTELSQVCVRINTLHHLESELEAMEKKLKCGWQDSTVKKDGTMVEESSDISSRFERARGSCKEGIQKLAEAGVHKAVYQHMKAVFWDGLYSGGVANARIDQVIHQLDAQLEVIASTVLGRLRNKLATALMRACFEAYILVLLGGGPSRAFQIQDASLLEEDVNALKELFIADGDGIPAETVDRSSSTIAQVLPLFSTETSGLIEKLRAAEGGRLKSSLPQNPKAWSSGDPNTIVRVLCYRADDSASKFLKKTYNLPKRI